MFLRRLPLPEVLRLSLGAGSAHKIAVHTGMLRNRLEDSAPLNIGSNQLGRFVRRRRRRFFFSLEESKAKAQPGRSVQRSSCSDTNHTDSTKYRLLPSLSRFLVNISVHPGPNPPPWTRLNPPALKPSRDLRRLGVPESSDIVVE